MFIWLILLIIIIAAVWYFNKSGQLPFFTNQQDKTPSEILKQRYARGEITKDEYEKQMEVIAEENDKVS